MHSFNRVELDIVEASNAAAIVASAKEYPSRLRFCSIMISLLIVIILGGMDFSIIGVAVPVMTQEYGTIIDIAWYNVAYRLTACATQLAWGRIFTFFPLRGTFLLAIAIFLAGSAIAASAPTSAVFIIGRSICGVGSAGLLTGTFCTLAQITPLRTRPIYTGIISGVEGVAIIMAPILGGVLTQAVSWRWCFYINLPIGAAAMGILSLSLPKVAKPVRSANPPESTWLHRLWQLDPVGILTLLVSVTCLFMGLSWAGTKVNWGQWQMILLLVVFSLALIAFLADQVLMGELASVPPRYLQQRTVMFASLFSFCLTGALGIIQYFLPIYFQVVHAISPVESGYMTLPSMAGFCVFLLAQGFITSYLGYYVPQMVMSSVLTSIGAGLITAWTKESDTVTLLAYQVLFGCGCGLALEIPQIAVQTVLSDADAATGIAVTLFAQNLGGALCISVAQQVFAEKVISGLRGKESGMEADALAEILTTGLLGLARVSLRDGMAQEDIIHVLEGAFRQVWIAALVLCCLTALFGPCVEWRTVKISR